MIEIDLNPDPATPPPSCSELLGIGLCVLMAGSGAYVVGMRYMDVLGCFAPLLGACAPFVAFLAIFIGIAWLEQRWRPPRPRCFAGVCGPNDYEELPAQRWRCRCGQRYALDGARFGRVFGDHVVPYMRREGRRWVDDRACREGAGG